jgi:hypothetical protein
MSKNNKPEDDSTDDYLKRLEQESSEKKREEALKILHREQVSPSALSIWWQSLRRKIAGSYELKKRDFLRQAKYSENKHLAIISVFFLGTILISWKIEEKYDKMRTRANSTKSLKIR